ncbi:hypothetical protein C8R47DRAFT_1069315 [Mycena vitilis]|nr:hypothetical protein C8R47DRAFT_1069315 [Mycena vitilis]
MSHPPKHERSSSTESAPRAVKKGRTDQPAPPQTVGQPCSLTQIQSDSTSPQPPRRTYQVRSLPDSSDDEDMPAPPRPQPPTRPKSGRPAHNDRAVRKDTSTAAAATLSGLVPPEPRTPPPKKIKEKKSSAPYSPFTTELLNFTTGLPIHLQASPNAQRTTGRASTHKPAAKVRVGLNNVRHSKHKGWTSAGRATTFSAYKCFEQWKNDYSPQQYALADCVDIIHAGNPLDRPKDIRARPVMFCWNTPDRRPPFASKGTRFPVYRAKYKCTGHCRHGNDAPQSSDDDSDSDSDDDDNGGSASDLEEPIHDDLADGGYVEVEDGDEDEDADSDSETEIDPSTDDIASLNKQLNSGAGKKARTKGLGQHKCKVILHAEVYSDDLSEIHFFQRHSHPEALEKYLDTSHYIRQCMLEMASLFNLPPSSIKRRE